MLLSGDNYDAHIFCIKRAIINTNLTTWQNLPRLPLLARYSKHPPSWLVYVASDTSMPLRFLGNGPHPFSKSNEATTSAVFLCDFRLFRYMNTTISMHNSRLLLEPFSFNCAGGYSNERLLTEFHGKRNAPNLL